MCLPMKGNPPEAYDEIKRYLVAYSKEMPPDFEMPLEKGQGRLEKRKFWISSDIGWFESKGEWSGLKSICMVDAAREVIRTGEIVSTHRYYISSLCADEAGKVAKPFAGIGAEKTNFIGVRTWSLLKRKVEPEHEMPQRIC